MYLVLQIVIASNQLYHDNRSLIVMRLFIIKACLFIAAGCLLLVLPYYLESLQPSSVCTGVRADGKIPGMRLLATLQLKHRLLILLASQGFSANLRGRKRKYSEIRTSSFTHRHYSSVWAYDIGTSEAVDGSPPYIAC